MVDNSVLFFLSDLIKYYTDRVHSLKAIIDKSHTAFVDYLNAKDFLDILKNLYLKLTLKEYDE